MQFTVKTKGHYDFVNITDQVQEQINNSDVKEGMCLVFVPGSTAAITTVEYESGVLEDIKDVLEKVAPEDFDYKHHKRWGDHNGAAHIKSALIGTDLAVPVENGQLQLGSWQQIVVVDFDERPRSREIIVKVFS